MNASRWTAITRSYAYAESDDLREWKNPQFILSMDADDPADTELYQFGCHKFGPIYVGYMSVYYQRPAQSVDIHLATSRDGINFTRVRRGEPFIPSGSLGYYDYMAMACSQPEPIVVDDTVYIYYAAANFSHAVNVERADPENAEGRRGTWPPSNAIDLPRSKRASGTRGHVALLPNRLSWSTPSCF